MKTSSSATPAATKKSPAKKSPATRKTSTKKSPVKTDQVRFNVSTLIKQFSVTSSSLTTEEELFGLLNSSFTIRPWETQGRITGWYLCHPESTSNPLGFLTWGLRLDCSLKDVKCAIEALNEIFLSDIRTYIPK
jgi:hypothetical protein